MRRHANASPVRFTVGSSIGGRVLHRACLGLLGTLILALSISLGASSALAAAPTVSIDPPGTVSYTTANLTGTIDPMDHETLYAFEYSTDQVNWSGFTYSGPLVAESGPNEVSIELTGLTPGTQYWVRLNAQNFIDPEVLSAEPNPTFTTTVLPAPSVAIDPVTAVTTSTAHFSGTIDPEAPAGNPEAANVSWHFECTPECPGLEGTIPADSEEHVVSADPTGLKPNTEYKVTLVASNAAGPVNAGPENFTTNVIAPTVETIPAFALVGGTKALLGGRVNPENAQTDYWFEYGTDTSYGISVPVTHDADAGTGEAPNFFTQEIPGLLPSSTYHFRIVASNSAGTVNGLDQAFTTPPAEGLGTGIGKYELPDGRVWEQVSPPDKNGWDIAPGGAVGAVGGGRLSFKSSGGFGDEPTSRGAQYNDYLSTRTSMGWVTHGISPQGAIFLSGIGYLGYSEELDKSLIAVYERQGRSLDPEIEGAKVVEVLVYLRDNLTAKYKGFGKDVGIGWAGGASADYTHVLVGSNEQLPSKTPCEVSEPLPEGQPASCLFELVNGVLRQASVNTSGAPSYGSLITGEHTVSDDGASLYFTEAGKIFRRLNASVTTEIGQSERTIPPVTPGGTTTFLQAEAAHGDRVLLKSTAELVNSDQNSKADLYLYDPAKPAGERLTMLSQGNLPGVEAVPGEEPEFKIDYTASKDLRRVYFLTYNQILAGQPTGAGRKLYLWEDQGGSTSLAYVASLSDVNLFKVSSDGRYLVFGTSTRETAYDNAGQSEYYRYDSQSGQVVCASCDPEARPAKSSPSSQDYLEITPPRNPLRNVSLKGQVFFQTYEGLSPHDSNGQQDVYEYENGLPHLISSGVGGSESVFLDASEDGNDIFVDSTDRFVGWDIDKNYDAYDARVDGGFAEPPPGILGCEGDSCQPAPNPPNDETPASASFNGPGNLPAPVSKALKAKPPTRAQKLAKALKACKKDKPKKRRAACEKKAKKRYGRSK